MLLNLDQMRYLKRTEKKAPSLETVGRGREALFYLRTSTWMLFVGSSVSNFGRALSSQRRLGRLWYAS